MISLEKTNKIISMLYELKDIRIEELYTKKYELNDLYILQKKSTEETRLNKFNELTLIIKDLEIEINNINELISIYETIKINYIKEMSLHAGQRH